MRAHIIETFDLTRVFERAPLARGLAGWSRNLKKLLGLLKPETINAVDHVNIRVRKREIFGLVGPNGAGKTTLIKLLCCLISPTSGTAKVNGFDITQDEVNVKGSVSFVAASGWLAFDWALSVRQNLRLFAALKGIRDREAKKRIEEALKIVGLKNKANSVPSILSSGMRQRASLAAGLIVTTPIFFLDEPTIGIDPATSHEIRDFIREILNRERGQTIFLTTHIMEEAEMMCDRVAIINEGRIVACDHPDNIIEKVRSEDIIEIVALNTSSELLGKLNGLDMVKNLTSRIEDPVIGKALIRIQVDTVEDALPAIIHAIEQEKGEISYAKQVRPTLEDAFIKLTAKEAKK